MRSKTDKFKFFLYWLLASWLPRNSFFILFKKCRELFEKWMMGSNCGQHVNINHGAEISTMARLGDYSDIGINCLLEGPVYVGKNVMIAPNCKFYTRNHNYYRTDIPMNRQGLSEPQTITVGDDVWFGTNCLIMSGVKIGSGAIIGAGSVVTKDIPQYAVAVGNPAKVIKYKIEEKK